MNEDTEEFYDEDYDESYDDGILEEVTEENAETQKDAEEKDPVIEEVKNQYSPDKKTQNALYMKIFEKYFEKELARNPYFEKKYKKELLSECYEWVKKQVQKMAKGGVAMIQSGKVFAMAVSYFDDEIYIKEQKEKEEKAQKLKELEQKKKENEILKAQKEKEKQEYDEWLKKPIANTSLSEEERQKWMNAEQGELF